MACEVKSLQQTKMESEHKRKKLETQLQEFMSRATEVERTKGELAERSHKLQVNTSTNSYRHQRSKDLEHFCYKMKGYSLKLLQFIFKYLVSLVLVIFMTCFGSVYCAFLITLFVFC